MSDLDRIPAPYRERVQRVSDAARAQGPCVHCDATPPHPIAIRRCGHRIAAALAPFLAIADEADAAALRALDTVRPFADAQNAKMYANDTRAAVWARRMAELDVTPAEAMRAAADEQPDPMAAAMMRMTASAWTKAGEEHDDDDTVPPDLGADAVRAVRSAQRAHLEATRAQADDIAALEPDDTFTLLLYVRDDTLVIKNSRGAQAALDGLVRYLADKPVDALRAVVAIVKTLPVTLGGQIDLGSRNRTAHDIIAALPGAIAQETTCRDGVRLAYALAEIDGIEIAARYNPEPAEVP